MFGAELDVMVGSGDGREDRPEHDAHAVQTLLSTLLTTAGGEFEMVE